MTGIKVRTADVKHIKAVPLYMYKCSTIVAEYMGHKDIVMSFIYTSIRSAVGQMLPYEILISGYSKLSAFARENAERAVDELFFLDDAAELGSYLATYYGARLAIA